MKCYNGKEVLFLFLVAHAKTFFYSPVEAMELLAMELKANGYYVARQLSYQDVTYAVQQVPMDPEFKRIYNECAKVVG